MALSFRTRGMSRSAKRRIIILIITFLVSIVFFYIVLNHHSIPATQEMKKPSLPTISVSTGGVKQLCLSGYRAKMSSGELGGYLLPLGSDRRISAEIRTYGAEVERASYQIRSADQDRIVSSQRISDLSAGGDSVTFDAELTNLISPGEQYILVIRLDTGGHKVWYYTRLQMTDNDRIGEMLQFMKNFHDKSLSEHSAEIGRYLETDKTEADDNRSLARVDIRSQIGDISLEGLSHKVVSDPVTSVTQIRDDTIQAELSYMIRIENELYMAKENYRVRYGAPRMYLLDFSRTLDVVPSEHTFSVKKNVLSVGIASTDMNTVTNEAGSAAAFVQAGGLYEYSRNKASITRIFSFGDDYASDPREANQDHEIRILNIDAAGSMDFAVYGYMNAGEHEGMNGVDLYHYDSATGISSEEGFIESRHSLSYIKDNFSELLYRTPGGLVYLMQNGRLLGIDLNTGETSLILKQMQPEQYSVSPDSRYIAWTDTSDPSGTIRIRDLSSGKTYMIKARDGEKLKVMCFMEDNLVYGTCNSASDQYMYRLTIVSVKNEKLTRLKDYQKKDIYIEKVTPDENAIRLYRIRRTGKGYKRTSSDTILNTLDTSKDTGASYTTESRLGRIRAIKLSPIYSDTPSEIRFADSRLYFNPSVISVDLYNK
ncbi:MAG: hypothetical protein SPL57_08100 [Lachnospiraceae bacterium]|nr:hypothetical protein [Lachnospiraceae bacterium]